MQTTTPTKTQLAEALGISRQEVHRYAKKGMPCESIEAARAWRMESVRVRISEPRSPAPTILVRLVRELQEAAALLLDEGRRTAFDAMVPTLRQALRRVPDNHRERVKFVPQVFDALTDDVHRVLSVVRIGNPDAPEAGESSEALAGEDAERMGAFWYAVAAGEIFVRKPTH